MAVRKKQPVPVAVPKKQPVPVAVPKKQPVPVAVRKKQPVPVAVPKKQPVPVAVRKKHSIALPCSPLLSYLFSITSYTPHHAHAPVALFFISLQKDRSRTKNPNDDYMGHNPIVRST